MPTQIERFSEALRRRASDYRVELGDHEIARLGSYYELLLKWNPRLHLVAPCSPEEFATRHVLESLTLVSHLSPQARVTDIGSGAGLPIIPCLIIRNDLRATLIESSQKKVVFLCEALRSFGAEEPPLVISARFENVPAPATDFVTCRALDQFQRLLPDLINWAPRSSTLLLFAGEGLRNQIELLIPSAAAERMPNSARRFLIIARRAEAP
ncbi:MAG: rRNA (guanine527-N7)-methyltransferase [Blastocatellia bacterium]|jgi:16S rRNA (guanine527-N7)-methyltransferase|nr:rRNA (guanine527-N7)-methyltransferase [Blastocatellia bacterium]